MSGDLSAEQREAMKAWAVAWGVATAGSILGSVAAIGYLVATGGRHLAEVGTGLTVLHAAVFLYRRRCVRRIAAIRPGVVQVAADIRS